MLFRSDDRVLHAGGQAVADDLAEHFAVDAQLLRLQLSIGYQCGFAYVIALMINQFGNAFTGHVNIIGLIFAIAALALILYMLVRPYKEATKLQTRVKVSM